MATSSCNALGLCVALLLTQLPTASARAAIDATEASRIALERVPGTVEQVAVSHEIRWEVFRVDVRDHNGVKYEVVIDARDGGILWANPAE